MLILNLTKTYLSKGICNLTKIQDMAIDVTANTLQLFYESIHVLTCVRRKWIKSENKKEIEQSVVEIMSLHSDYIFQRKSKQFARSPMEQVYYIYRMNSSTGL